MKEDRSINAQVIHVLKQHYEKMNRERRRDSTKGHDF